MGRSKEQLRMGLVGTGGIADIAHFPAIARSERAKLVAVCDVNRDRADNAARRWGASETYYDINEIARSKNIDAIVVATSNKYHRDAVIAAAMEKKHVLCEKPIATKLTDAEQMITACEKNRFVSRSDLASGFGTKLRSSSH